MLQLVSTFSLLDKFPDSLRFDTEHPGLVRYNTYWRCRPATYIKASHVFNLREARGVISVTERQSYILGVRQLAKACGEAWLATEAGGAPA